MSRSNKILIGVAVFSILLCSVPCLYFGLVGDPAHRAETYVITDKNQAALIIQNNTSEFFILDLKLDGELISKEVIMPKGRQGVVAIPSGQHELVIHYSDHILPPSFGFYVSAVLKENFTVGAGRAVVYSIEGGDVQGMFYDPPELNGK